MLLTTREGLEVEVTVYGESDDIQIDSAFFVETGASVPDAVVEQLQDDHAEKLYEKWFDMQIGRAEEAYEGDR
jgi:hypothetical protein